MITLCSASCFAPSRFYFRCDPTLFRFPFVSCLLLPTPCHTPLLLLAKHLASHDSDTVSSTPCSPHDVRQVLGLGLLKRGLCQEQGRVRENECVTVYTRHINPSSSSPRVTLSHALSSPFMPALLHPSELPWDPVCNPST
jgi:hypothetical protein